jgi:hypothetical protein
MFIPHFYRWQNFILVCSFMPKALLDIPDDGASLLEEVGISLLEDIDMMVFNHLDHAQALAVSRIVSSSSHLRVFRWHHHFHILRFVKLPWWQLTTIDIQSETSFAEALEMIRMSPKLVKLHLHHIVGQSPNSFSPRRPILAPELRSLDLYFHPKDNEDLGPLFDELDLPALQSVRIIYNVDVVPTWTQSKFISLVTRSKCALEKFTLKYTNVSEGDLIAFLQTSPSLAYLDINNRGEINVTDQLLLMLTVDSEQAICLCPNLQFIKFGKLYFTWTDGVLAAMLASRWRRSTGGQVPSAGESSRVRVASLKHVALEFGEHKVDSVDYLRVKEMRSEGLKVSIWGDTQYAYFDEQMWDECCGPILI